MIWINAAIYRREPPRNRIRVRRRAPRSAFGFDEKDRRQSLGFKTVCGVSRRRNRVTKVLSRRGCGHGHGPCIPPLRGPSQHPLWGQGPHSTDSVEKPDSASVAKLDSSQCSIRVVRSRSSTMNHVTVTIAPVQGGWSVLSRLSANPLMFLSRRDAEEQAHRLARLAARLGRNAEVRFHHRGGDISVQPYAAHGTAAPMAPGPVDAHVAALAHSPASTPSGGGLARSLVSGPFESL